MKQRRKVVILVLLAALLPMFMGCYGPFPLTKHVYKINGDVSEDKWVQSLVMWAFGIVQVYSVATFGDLIVCNLVEFWTGKRLVEPPASAKASDALEQTDANASLRIGPEGNTATLRVRTPSGQFKEVRFVRVNDTTCEIRGVNDALIGSVVRSEDGTLLFHDDTGRVVTHCSPEEVGKLLARS